MGRKFLLKSSLNSLLIKKLHSNMKRLQFLKHFRIGHRTSTNMIVLYSISSSLVSSLRKRKERKARFDIFKIAQACSIFGPWSLIFSQPLLESRRCSIHEFIAVATPFLWEVIDM